MHEPVGRECRQHSGHGQRAHRERQRPSTLRGFGRALGALGLRTTDRRRNRAREDGQQDQRGDDGQRALVTRRRGVHVARKARHEHARDREQHQRRCDPRPLPVEALHAVAQPADEKCETEHEQDIAND